MSGSSGVPISLGRSDRGPATPHRSRSVPRPDAPGLYTDPKHVFSYDDWEVRQEFSIRLHATVTGGTLGVSDESHEVQVFAPHEIENLEMVDSIRLRIEDYLGDLAPAIR